MLLNINHNLLYRRSTHDENGSFKSEKHSLWNKLPSHVAGLVHFLSSEKWFNIERIMKEIYTALGLEYELNL